MPGDGQAQGAIGQAPGVAPAVPVFPTGFTLGMIANTVESFSGKERVEEYFEKIELRAKLDNWNEATTATIVKFRLTGDAYQFYKSDFRHLRSLTKI